MIELTIGDDRIAEARFDAPGEKVNILSEQSMARLAQVLDEVETAVAGGACRALIITSSKKGIFLAGADLKAFVPVADSGDPALAASKAREGQNLFARIANLPVPSVAAINGVCLGGGLELALACTSRIAADASEVSIGLPEVRLGLVPGWGGTQRLPRLIGPSRALDLILTGRALPARKAKRMGIVDLVVPPEGMAGAARAEALRLASGKRPRRPKWSLIDRTAATRALLWRISRRRVLAETRGHYPAPLAAIECVASGFGGPIEEGLALEARHLGDLIIGDVSRNLVRIFLASRAAGSTREKDESTGSAPGGRVAPRVSRIGVIGAGTMGGGIAAVAAMSGLSVRLKDVDADALARGMKQVQALARSAARKGRLPVAETERRAALVAPTIDMTGFGRCDLIVEAVLEDLEIKKAVLKEVEKVTPPSTVFATNTSSLPVAGLSAAASRPQRVIGLHFFNPVQKMPLVEIVRGPNTDPDAVEIAVELAKKMGKTPVVVNDTPGFIVNRILMPYLGGAIGLLRTSGPGAIPSIDSGLVRFGMPMGPFALLDTIGIDVASRVAGVLSAAFGSGNGPGNGAGKGAGSGGKKGASNGWGPEKMLIAMAKAGSLGAKSGRGFYNWSSGKKKGVAADLASWIPPANGSAPRPVPADAVADTLVDLMINEAAKLLAEKAVDSPEVIDLAMVFGTGFPPFRGGLLRHADAVGREKVAERLRARGVSPAPLLEQKGRFYA